MSELNVQGFGAEAYVEAMADVMPYRFQPFKRMVRDIAVRRTYEAMANQEPVSWYIESYEPEMAEMSAAIAERALVGEVYGALPAILIMLWPLLQPIVIAVIRKLIDYWRNRPEAVQSIQAAARAGS